MPDNQILCLVRDLLFYSKIRAAAAAAGVPLKSLRDPAALTEQAGTGLIVDLNQPDALPPAAAWMLRTGRPVVGFVSHIDGAAISAARAAGITRILARSQFEQNLPAILRECSKPRPQTTIGGTADLAHLNHFLSTASSATALGAEVMSQIDSTRRGTPQPFPI